MSLNHELLKCKARLADLKSRQQKLERTADNAVIILREIIDPYEPLHRYDMERARVAFDQLADAQKEHKSLGEQVERIERDLNG